MYCDFLRINSALGETEGPTLKRQGLAAPPPIPQESKDRRGVFLEARIELGEISSALKKTLPTPQIAIPTSPYYLGILETVETDRGKLSSVVASLFSPSHMPDRSISSRPVRPRPPTWDYGLRLCKLDS